jgi:hypothetical protein
MSARNKTLRSAATLVLIVIGVALVFGGNLANKAATEKNRGIGLQNNTYNRIMVCIASVTPAERTPAYVKQCYDEAEKQTGVKVTRFGHGL